MNTISTLPKTKSATTFGLHPTDDLNDLRMSEKALPLYEHVKRFVAETVTPMSEKFEALVKTSLETRVGNTRRVNWTCFRPRRNRQRKKVCGTSSCRTPKPARACPISTTPISLSNSARIPMASEVMNCSAPDTGNMEVLERVGTPEQKEQWLKPLLDGEIRSAYAMTEVHHASSDARNINTRAKLVGDDVGDQRREALHFRRRRPALQDHDHHGADQPRRRAAQTAANDPGAKDTPGVNIVGAMHVFGDVHAPHGHMHIIFDNVRVPAGNMLLGEGRGFEISQLRLGPGRIHHCMRAIGQAEKALDLMVTRGLSRKAFGKTGLARRQSGDHLSGAHRDRGRCACWCSRPPRPWTCSATRKPASGSYGQGEGA